MCSLFSCCFSLKPPGNIITVNKFSLKHNRFLEFQQSCLYKHMYMSIVMDVFLNTLSTLSIMCDADISTFSVYHFNSYVCLICTFVVKNRYRFMYVYWFILLIYLVFSIINYASYEILQLGLWFQIEPPLIFLRVSYKVTKESAVTMGSSVLDYIRSETAQRGYYCKTRQKLRKSIVCPPRPPVPGSRNTSNVRPIVMALVGGGLR